MRLAVAVFLLAFLSLGAYMVAVRGKYPEVSQKTASQSDVSSTVASGPTVRSTTAAAGGAALLTVRDSVAPYPVVGGTEAEILRSLVAGGPSNEGERFFGMTEADMRLDYRTAEVTTHCSLVGVQVRLGVTTTLPEWDRPRGSDGDLRRDWHRFLGALGRHEARHKEIIENGAAKVYRAVASLQRPTCAEVESEARRRLDRIEIEMEAAHRLYDEQTGHGRTEGAAWPLP